MKSFRGRLYSICCHDGTYLYRKKNQEGMVNLWPFLMTESQIMFGCYLATGVIKEVWRKNEGRQSGELEEQF